MQRAIVYQTRTNMPKTQIIMNPVAEGLKRAGFDVVTRESMEYPRGDEGSFDLGAVWGDTAKSLDILASRFFPLKLQVDNGYLHRVRWEGHYSLSWGGQRQCHEYLWSIPQSPERFAALHEEIKPWRFDGDDILLLTPSVKQGNILGFDVHQWARQVSDHIQRHTKKRVVVRIKRYNVDIPLRDVLQSQSIFVAVGYNTKGLVECLLEGLPVFSLGPCVTQWMGKSDLSAINFPIYPHNRVEFFERLSNTQWLLSEIAEGLPFQKELIPG